MENLNTFILEIKEYNRHLIKRVSAFENGKDYENISPFKYIFKPFLMMLWYIFALGDPYDKKRFYEAKHKLIRLCDSVKIELSYYKVDTTKNSVIHNHIDELKKLTKNEVYAQINESSIYYDEFIFFNQLIEDYSSWYTENIIKKESVLKNKESEIIDFIDLKTQKEQIRLLYDLGIIHFLKDKYPKSTKVDNALAGLIASILRVQKTSIYSSLSYLLKDDASNKNYPKQTERTKEIIRLLNANEQV
jgi:hypothetical protein